MTHGHMARMHMTKPSTQAREAYADAYRWTRQNLYFGLPKLTSESAKLTSTFPSEYILRITWHLHERQVSHGIGEKQ